MDENLKKYAEGMGAERDVFKWIDTHVPEGVNQQEAEHVIDYLCSDKRPKRLTKASYEQMKKNTDKWVKAMNKKGAAIKEKKDDVKTVLDFEDGFRVVQLIGENAYKREGFLMRHCVAGYYGKEEEIYSLRDKNNMPHATLSGSSQQIKGKGNGCISPKYIRYVVGFLEYMDIEVRDSEMENLGYVNVEDIKDDNIDWGELFRGKYFYKDNIDKLKYKEGKPYQSTLLWQKFGILKNWKHQFNLKDSLAGTEKYIEGKQNNPDFSVNSGLDWSVNSGLDWSVNSGRNYSVNSGRNYSVNSGRNYSVNSGLDCSVIYLNGVNAIGVGHEGSIIQGVKGSAFTLPVVEDDKVIKMLSAVIDGKKFKEKTWYGVKDGKLAEVEPTGKQQGQIDKYEATRGLIESMEDFYK